MKTRMKNGNMLYRRNAQKKMFEGIVENCNIQKINQESQGKITEKMVNLRVKVPVNNILVMSGLTRKREETMRKDLKDLTTPLVKQISSC